MVHPAVVAADVIRIAAAEIKIAIGVVVKSIVNIVHIMTRAAIRMISSTSQDIVISIVAHIMAKVSDLLHHRGRRHRAVMNSKVTVMSVVDKGIPNIVVIVNKVQRRAATKAAIKAVVAAQRKRPRAATKAAGGDIVTRVVRPGPKCKPRRRSAGNAATVMAATWTRSRASTWTRPRARAWTRSRPRTRKGVKRRRRHRQRVPHLMFTTCRRKRG